MQYLFECSKNLSPTSNSLSKGRKTSRNDHEFLKIDRGIRMGPSVDNICHRYRQNIRLFTTQPTVERNSLCRCCRPSCRQGNTQNCIGSKRFFVLRSIQLNHQTIQPLGVSRIFPSKKGGNLLLHICHSFQDPFPSKPFCIPVPQLQCLVNTRTCPTRNHRRAHGPTLQNHISLKRGVPPGINNLPCCNCTNLGLHRSGQP